MNTFEFRVNKNQRRNVLKKGKSDKGPKNVIKRRYHLNRKVHFASHLLKIMYLTHRGR
jgi:hypothetical protein